MSQLLSSFADIIESHDYSKLEVEIKYQNINKEIFKAMRKTMSFGKSKKYTSIIYPDGVREVDSKFEKKTRIADAMNGALKLSISREEDTEEPRDSPLFTRVIKRYSAQQSQGRIDLSKIGEGDDETYELEFEMTGDNINLFLEEAIEIERDLGNETVFALNELFDQVNSRFLTYSLISKPRDLTPRDLTDDGLWNSFAVGVKLDGLLKYIIECKNGYIELTDKGYVDHNSEGDIKSVYVAEKMEGVYYIFDCIVYGGDRCDQKDYIQRFENISPRDDSFKVKEIFYTRNLFDNVRDALKYKEELGLDDDGLIFTPIDSPYITKGQLLEKGAERYLSKALDVCKWKPKEKLSLDLELVGKSLFVAGGRKPFSQRGIRFDTKEYKSGILEFFPIYENNRLVKYEARRERTDKSFPNSYYVVSGLLKLAERPVELETLLGKGIGLQRAYHNDIKRMLINKVNADYILDIGSGKGGDLHKWNATKVKRVFGIEPNEENLKELRNRKHRGLKFEMREVKAGGEDLWAYEKAFDFLNPKDGDVVALSFMLSLSFFWRSRSMKRSLFNNIKWFKKECERRGAKFKLVLFTIEGERTTLDLECNGEMKGSYNLKRRGDEILVDIPDSAIVHQQTEYLVDLKELYCEVGMTPYYYGYADKRDFMSDDEKRFSRLFSYSICKSGKSNRRSSHVIRMRRKIIPGENEFTQIEGVIHAVRSIDGGDSLRHCISKALKRDYRLGDVCEKMKQIRLLSNVNVYNITTRKVLKKGKGDWICVQSHADGSFSLVVAKSGKKVMTTFDSYEDVEEILDHHILRRIKAEEKKDEEKKIEKIEKVYKPENMGITLTFGEVAENHAGMQQIGDKGEKGLEEKDLKAFKKLFDERDFKTEMYDLKDNLPEEYEDYKGVQPEDGEALVLIVRGGIEYFDSTIVDMKEEQLGLEYDTKAKMYGRVVNKKARHNLCFDDKAQAPDYENGKGTIIPYSDVPKLSHFRDELNKMMKSRGIEELKVEGNYYYDPKSCGIGYHGDTERRIVIALRLGKKIPLAYRWYHQSKPISKNINIELREGDIYFMSHKATGNDWKSKSLVTLRHAAGKCFINK